MGIGYKTAANNCSRIKARLGVTSTVDLIRIAMRYSLVDRDASEQHPHDIRRTT
jgi:hypothetical protein